MTGRREWLRVSPAADGPGLVAMTVLPAGVAAVVVRRRARRRDGLLAWRYRAHGGVAADSQREHDRSWADPPAVEHHRADQQLHARREGDGAVGLPFGLESTLPARRWWRGQLGTARVKANDVRLLVVGSSGGQVLCR